MLKSNHLFYEQFVYSFLYFPGALLLLDQMEDFHFLDPVFGGTREELSDLLLSARARAGLYRYIVIVEIAEDIFASAGLALVLHVAVRLDPEGAGEADHVVVVRLVRDYFIFIFMRTFLYLILMDTIYEGRTVALLPRSIPLYVREAAEHAVVI